MELTIPRQDHLANFIFANQTDDYNGPMAKRGRKPVKASEQLTSRIDLGMKRADMQSCRRAARAAKMKLPDWARSVLIAAATR
jgi:hypothetical protein